MANVRLSEGHDCFALNAYRQAILRHITPSDSAAREHWKCKASAANTGANDPQDCDWPNCGCDPSALAKLRDDSQRMWDLVRYQRDELHEANLISDDEYALLAKDHAGVKRLESYDAVRASVAKLFAEERLAEMRLIPQSSTGAPGWKVTWCAAKTRWRTSWRPA